jgi:hypothetical protein
VDVKETEILELDAAGTREEKPLAKSNEKISITLKLDEGNVTDVITIEILFVRVILSDERSVLPFF